MTFNALEITVKNDLRELSRTSELVSEFWTKNGLPPEAEFDATLAIEEILSNVIRHGCDPNREYDIRVRLWLEDGCYKLEVSDNAQPYNPLLRPDPNLDLPVEQRRPGGLGVFLVKKLADDLRYEYREGRNVLQFTKRLPAAS